MAATAGRRLLSALCRGGFQAEAALSGCQSPLGMCTGLGLASFQQTRGLGGGYEFWGKKSAYTEGTDFLGTPKRHLELVGKRPLSPDVFEIDGWNPHYKFPWGAISSITIRGTGVVLSLGTMGAGVIALAGDVPATVEFVKAYWLLCFPAKFGVAFPLIYHYLGGLRHIWWDHAKHGNQAEKASPLELGAVEQSSMVILGIGAAAACYAAVL